MSMYMEVYTGIDKGEEGKYMSAIKYIRKLKKREKNT
jgi:hypothetical protein